MSGIIVRSSEKITLLGGGKARPGELAEALSLAPRLLAADGGAAFAVAHGHVPEAVIGDMDSLPDAVRARLSVDRLHLVSDQHSTDFDKSLRSVRAPLVIGVGFLGRRVDHQLACFNALVRHREQPCILLGKRDVVFAAPARIGLHLASGARVSLFPLAQVSGRSEGLRWPIDGLDFTPGGLIGTSNRVAEGHVGPVRLTFDRPGMLVILERSALRAAMAGLEVGGRDVPAR